MEELLYRDTLDVRDGVVRRDVQLSNLPFIIGGIIIVAITLLTILTA